MGSSPFKIGGECENRRWKRFQQSDLIIDGLKPQVGKMKIFSGMKKRLQFCAQKNMSLKRRN
jgi:hypothetical protein